MIKSVFLLSGGALVAQVINFLLLIYLARSVSADEYGIYALAVTYVGYFSIVFSAKYHHAVLPERQENLSLLITAVVFYSSLLVFALCLGVFVLADYLTQVAGVKNALLIVVSGWFSSLYLFLYYFHIRRDAVKDIFVARVLSPFIGAVVTVVLLSFDASASSALIGYSLAMACSCLLLVRAEMFEFDLARANQVLRKNISYPLYLLPSGVVEIFNSSFLMVVSGAAFGLKEAAAVGLFQRLVMAPQGIVVSVIGDLFRKRICQDGSNHEKRLVFIKSGAILLAFSMLASALVYVFVQYLMVELLGEKWAYAVEYVLVLLPVFFISFFASPLSFVLYNGRGKRVDLIIQLITAATLLLLYYYLEGMEFYEFVLVYVAVICVKYFIELVMSWVYLRWVDEAA